MRRMSGGAPPDPLPARRSCLSVPASSSRKLKKAAGIAADELVFDLEDAVAASAKNEAREGLAAALSDPSLSGGTVAVRVNAPRTAWCHLDLAALGALSTQPHSVIVPKVESGGDLNFVDRLLDGVEAGRRARPLRVQALIETAAGLAALGEIAAAGERLEALILGYADLAASLGRSRKAAAPATWIAAQDALLIAARANGLQAIDGPFLGVEPDGAFLSASLHARDVGFDGKWAIHPSQVSALNEVFTPTAEEVEHARAVIEVLERAEREGGQGAATLDGEMVDEALRTAALRTLARAEKPAR